MTPKPTEKKSFIMYHPGKTPDGKGTFIEHPLQADNREEAKAQAMGVVRVLDIKEMHLVEEPGTLVWYSWPMKPSG